MKNVSIFYRLILVVSVWTSNFKFLDEFHERDGGKSLKK